MSDPAAPSTGTTGRPGRRLGVLISGRGSNLQSLIDACRDGRLAAEIAVVMSNRADAYGLERAAAAGIPTVVLSHRGWPSREAYDEALAAELTSRQVDYVCLAGFMRIIGAPLLAAFPNRVVNIHPSLLPAFPGVDAQAQAVAHGVRVSGATVHLVDAGLDSGPIIEQRAVPVLPGDTAASLSARILDVEHQLYPAALATLLAGGWTIDGRRFIPAGAAAQS